MKLFKKNIIQIIGLMSAINFLFLFCYGTGVVRAEKVEKFEQNGMTFVVGRHEPEKRVRPKLQKEVVKKTVIKEKIIERGENTKNEEENNNEETVLSDNDKEIEENIDKSEKNNWKNIFQELLDNLKEKVENILNRLGIVEKKVESIDNLIETTTILTGEIVEQNKRIEVLEEKVLKKDN